jgi:signal transduction histidine kinase
VAGRPGLQRELLAGLALVMGLATLVLVGLIFVHHEWTLRATLGPALVAEARAGAIGVPALAGTSWWERRPDGRFEAWQPGARAPDPLTQRLAEQADERGAALLQLGGLGDPIRFAAPVPARRSVAVARLPEVTSHLLRRRPLLVIAALGAADLAVFTIFAAVLLRRRVVRPLEELAAAARAVGAGEARRAPVAGPRETAAVAEAWNEMTEALESRSEELAKSVAELRAANAELRRTRAGLDRAERLAVVGRLAAGVAHEVGNPIGAMLALGELAARDPGLSEASRAHLARVAREGERVRGILRQLLDFSRPRRSAPAALDLAHSVEEAWQLVAAQKSHRQIRFELRAEPETPRAWADADALQQILLNLLLNAADALAGVAEPRILVELRPAVLRARRGDADARDAAGRGHADGVECLVADNGCGMGEADRERVFDPFFSTKPPGAGTGLGLSTALHLAEEMDGALALAEAPPGYATGFALRLPATHAAAGSAVDCAAGEVVRVTD